MVHSPARFLAAGFVAALVVLAALPALAFNPQPDPPGFGAFGITELQRAHLHVALPAVQRGARGAPPDPCAVTLHFVDVNGVPVASQAASLLPGQGTTLIFTPARANPTAADVAPVRHQLRAVILEADGSVRTRRACTDMVATVQVDGVGGSAPSLTLSPFDLTGLDGNRPTLHLFGPLVIGFGHTFRLSASYVGTPRGRHTGLCRVAWAFFDETGARVAAGDGSVRPGGTIFADFAHTDANRGPVVLRAEAVAVGDVNGDCPSDAVIGTSEGFESDTGMSHTIVPAQIVLPASLLPAVQ